MERNFETKCSSLGSDQCFYFYFDRARHLMLDIQTLLPHSKSGIVYGTGILTHDTFTAISIKFLLVISMLSFHIDYFLSASF